MRQVVCVCSEHRLGNRATNLPGQFLLLSECRRLFKVRFVCLLVVLKGRKSIGICNDRGTY